MILFLVLSTLFLAGLHVYLYRRLLRDTGVGKRWRKLGILALAALGLLLVTSRLARFVLPTGWSLPYATSGWLWMGLATYLLCCLVAVDVLWLAARAGRRLAAKPAQAPDESRRLFLSRAVAGAAVAASGAATSYGYWRAFHPAEITELGLKLRGLPKALEGFGIVQLSDVHVGGVIERGFLEELIARVNALKPDLLVVTGDLVDGDVATLGPAVAAFRNVRSRYGAYFVTGNHEYYSGDEDWARALPGLGLTVLRNQRVSIGEPGASFDLVGVDDWSARGVHRYDLDQATFGRDLERPAVLLAHQPRDFRNAVAKGIGLQLSGHTHGGQFFPGTLLVPAVWEYPVGHFRHGDGHLYVSRGTGFWGPPLRLGSAPEIVKLTLLS